MFQESQQIGVYTLIRKLGQGGFGEVWLAENRNHAPSEKVAIKLPRNDQIDLQTVKDEIFNWILSGKHKNILPIIECETFNNQIAIVSEFAPDGSLQDLINKKGSLSISEAVEITIGILDGLVHLHNRKIIHRDLKPDNVLFQGRIPRLTDFGISRAMSAGSQSQTISGTFSYMAPEAFDGKRNEKTDIWAVGVILYQLLTGNLPFPQKEMIELVGALARKAPTPLPDSVPTVLRYIAQKSLAKETSARYQTAAEMSKELQNFRAAHSSLFLLLPAEPPISINNDEPIPSNNSVSQNGKPQSNETETIVAKSSKKKERGLIYSIIVFFSLVFFVSVVFSGLGYFTKFVVKKLSDTFENVNMKPSPSPTSSPRKTATPTPKPSPTCNIITDDDCVG